MSKPLIGLTTTRIPNPLGQPAFGSNEPYSGSVSAAGGLPLLIPLNLSDDDLDALLPHLDGVLFTGGGDIDPQLYGSTPHPRVEGLHTQRDHLESYLVRAVIQAGKPFLGICRGCQMVNVTLGGSLYEHLPEQYPGGILHDCHDHPRDFLAHPVNLAKKSHLAHLLAEATIQVNSLHHQGIRQLANGLLASAHAPDGLVEAFELPDSPFGLAVQWHPEELQQHEPMRNLFRQFIRACTPAGDQV